MGRHIRTEPDGRTLELIGRASRALGERWAPTITVIEIGGVRHTWGNCPFGGDEATLVMPTGSRNLKVTLEELTTIADCGACAMQLRPDGGIFRWLQRQLAPTTALDTANAEHALAVCRPTALVSLRDVSSLLEQVATRFALQPHLDGPVRLVTRDTVTTGLTGGVHSPDGRSIVSAESSHTSGYIGQASPATGVDTAEAFLALGHHFPTAADAWAALSAAEHTPRRLPS